MYYGIRPHYIVIPNVIFQILKQKMGRIHFYRHALFNKDLMGAYVYIYVYTTSNVRGKYTKMIV